MMFCILSGVSPKTEWNVCGTWMEYMGWGLESKDQVVRWRGDDSSDAKPHTCSMRVEQDYRSGKTGARARASGQNKIRDLEVT